MKVCIIGAGIAGLTTSFYLRRLGYTVTVYERNDILTEIGAGIQLPPNALRLLTRLGLDTKVLEAGFEPSGIEIRRYDDGELLQRLPCAPVLEKAFGARYMLIHRPTYQRILYDACVTAGVDFVWGVQIRSVEQEVAAVIMPDGESVPYDLIVAADGVNSSTRQMLYGNVAGASQKHLDRAYRALIPAAQMSTIPYGQTLMASNAITNWIGPRRHVVGYPISKEFYNFVLCHPGPTEQSDSWNQPGSVVEMHETFADFEPRLRSVFGLIHDVRAWQLQEAPPMNHWASKTGRVVLVGDAAHAMLPYTGQGAAQAVEDAAVLAACLEHFVPHGKLKLAMDAYFLLRNTRTDRMMAAARSNGELWALDDGPEQRKRDLKWKEMAERNRQDAGEDVGNLPDELDNSRKQQQIHLAWMLGTDVEADAMAFLKSKNGESQPAL